MGLFGHKRESDIITACKGYVAQISLYYADKDLGCISAAERLADMLRKIIDDDPKKVERYIEDNKANGITPEVWVYGCFNNFSGDILESGQCHVYRGSLSQEGAGMLKVFDDTADCLVELQSIDPSFRDQQKSEIRRSIASIG